MIVFLRNKRGSIAVGIMTILVVIIYVYLLFSLQINSSNVKEEFDEVYVSGGVYGVVAGLDNSMQLILINSFLKSYEETLSENSLKIDSVNLNEVFRKKIEENIEDVSKKILVANNKEVLFVKVLSSPKKIVFDEESVSLEISPEIIKKEYKLDERNFSVEYKYNIENKVGFDVFNLSSFNKILSVYKDCSGFEKSSGEIRGCLKDDLLEYDVELLKSEDSDDKKSETLTFKLTTKKEFFIDGENKKISFDLEFVVRLVNEGGLLIVS